LPIGNHLSRGICLVWYSRIESAPRNEKKEDEWSVKK
jgi:hypothetical protein